MLLLLLLQASSWSRPYRQARRRPMTSGASLTPTLLLSLPLVTTMAQAAQEQSQTQFQSFFSTCNRV